MIRFLDKSHNLIHFLKIFLIACLCVFSWQKHAWAQDDAAAESYYLQQKLLNQVEFTENSTVPLKGSWQYYPRQLIVKPSAMLKSEPVNLPISFKELTGTNKNYGTFIGHFKLPKEYVGRRIAIFIPNQFGAYRMYLNGDFLLRVGEVGKDKISHQTENASRIAFFVAKKEYFTITIQASNFNPLHGGLENPMRIGLGKTITQQFQQLMMSIGLLCGAVLGLSIFTLMFSIFQRKINRSSIRVFVFGIFILFLALHNLFSAPYAYTTFTNLSWIWGVRLEYLFTYFTIASFLTYMHLLNWRYLHPIVYFVAMSIFIVDIIITLFTEPEIFEYLAFYSFLFSLVVICNFAYGFYLNLKHKQKYSSINLWAVILLCVTFVHDFLLTLNLIESFNLTFISTSFYALLIMFQQSKNYAKHTHYVEQLNNNLLELNSSLDQKVQERTLQLNQLNQQLELQIQIDALTGAFNRRALNAEIQRLFTLTKNHTNHTLAFAMLDVDFFKNYNDYYGHLKGDVILQDLVKIIQRALPPSAYVARYGGEEFAIILHNVPSEVVLNVLRKVLNAVRQARLEHLNRPDQKPYVTLSMGVSWMDQNHPYADIHELMKAADVQLYAAKNTGRDQYQAFRS
ncbi:diguanylate cyclase [Acinetobacter sp. ANC 4779]|uniref:GGDEF domain-containing protein n=1 Tax=Acinetobacter sp. ANC 4779 TaxID=2529848 RepID=UPI00103B6BEF|nr:GGDEF domain-containing protein [Acinetobacter sp. ANC 4779]TCB50471.1 diguanylate cyclase [Acinetobacter sp. ANC 4779]